MMMPERERGTRAKTTSDSSSQVRPIDHQTNEELWAGRPCAEIGRTKLLAEAVEGKP